MPGSHLTKLNFFFKRCSLANLNPSPTKLNKLAVAIATTFLFERANSKCISLPKPPDKIIGFLNFFGIRFKRFKSGPFPVPSLSIELMNNSPNL